MDKLLSSLRSSAVAFSREEEGAQVIEYALIIAVVSIALVVALQGLVSGNGNSFSTFISRVATCLTGTCS